MTGLVVRSCGAGDAALATRVLSDVVDGRADAEHLGRVLSDDDVILCVATVGGESAGIACGHVYSRLTDTRRATLLYEVDVAEAFRRQGVGTALMEAFAAECRSRGAPVHWLVTEHGNQAAVGLYAKTGGVLSPTDDAMFTFGEAPKPTQAGAASGAGT